MLEKTSNLDFYQEMVVGIIIKGGSCVGVKTSLGLEIKSTARDRTAIEGKIIDVSNNKL